MNLRQKIQIILLIFLILFAFASYHEGSGSTIWLQWLAIIAIMTYMFIFDIAFTNESSFIFDPDAENWRRKTVCNFFLLFILDESMLSTEAWRHYELIVMILHAVDRSCDIVSVMFFLTPFHLSFRLFSVMFLYRR
jgi:hypothetical protein